MRFGIAIIITKLNIIDGHTDDGIFVEFILGYQCR